VKADLSEHLSKFYPQLDQLTPGGKAYVCGLAADRAFGINPHTVVEDAGALKSRQRNKVMEAGEFNQFNDKVKWFKVGARFSRNAGIARPYWLENEELRKQIWQFTSQELEQEKFLTDYKGRRITNHTLAIIGKDTNGHTRRTKGQLRNCFQPIDIGALKRLRENPPTDKPINIEAFRLKIDLLINAAQTIEGGPGIISQYREAKNSRLMGLGFHLQNMPSAIRDAALNNQWIYDIDQCHLSLMYGLALKHGVNLEYLEYPVKNKAKFRNDLALRHELTIDEVKKSINALIYGASLSLNHSLFDILGEQAEEFIADPEIKALAKDIRTARKVITEKEARFSNGSVTNIVGKWRSIPRTNYKRVVSHILTGYETLALEIAMERTNGDLSLLIHDGFVSPGRLDIDQIVSRFYQNTGLTISYSEEHFNH
jgi:hypothetical protein